MRRRSHLQHGDEARKQVWSRGDNRAPCCYFISNPSITTPGFSITTHKLGLHTWHTVQRHFPPKQPSRLSWYCLLMKFELQANFSYLSLHFLLRKYQTRRKRSESTLEIIWRNWKQNKLASFWKPMLYSWCCLVQLGVSTDIRCLNTLQKTWIIVNLHKKKKIAHERKTVQ